MCKFNTSYRYEALKVLRHPWITRNINSVIPETLIECYCKMNMIKEFRQLISIGIVLHVYKATHQNLFSKQKTTPTANSTTNTNQIDETEKRTFNNPRMYLNYLLLAILRAQK